MPTPQEILDGMSREELEKYLETKIPRGERIHQNLRISDTHQRNRLLRKAREQILSDSSKDPGVDHEATE